MSFPLLYEINTRCWLSDLSKERKRSITLAEVPDDQFERWQRLGFTHIWLMGVWTTGPRARAVALNAHSREYSEALPDLREEDVAGSPYAIADYSVALSLGGDAALREFRNRLNSRGLKLLLDFVPNHLGVDHPWLNERPELFVQGQGKSPETFLQETNVGPRWLAHGKDPYFPPWTDTVQLDYRRNDTRTDMTQILRAVADKCDGVRCDMAMLLLNDVFAKTWERFPIANQHSSITGTEFWLDAISRTKKAFSDFLFLAEAYWGLESRLQALGFDYTYDKVLYDHLIARNNEAVQQYLLEKSPQILAAGTHFLENHDEKRITPLLSPAEHHAAALLILGLPGARFLHEGQLTGVRRRVPVQLVRRASESVNLEIQQVYEYFLTTLKETSVGRGKWEILCPNEAWSGNPTARNITLIQWQTSPAELDLVVINLASHPSQCYAPLKLPNQVPRWSMEDLLGKQRYVKDSSDVNINGLYLDLSAHAAQLFHFRPVGA